MTPMPMKMVHHDVPTMVALKVKIPTYNRLMSRLSDILYSISRWCEGQSFRYGSYGTGHALFEQDGLLFDIPVDDHHRELGLRALLRSEEACEAMGRGFERGQNILAVNTSLPQDVLQAIADKEGGHTLVDDDDNPEGL